MEALEEDSVPTVRDWREPAEKSLESGYNLWTIR